MERRQHLQIPGPTNVPDRILRSLSAPLINHRGPEFEALLTYCVEGLKKVFRTNNDIVLFPSSGSGGLESAIVNFISPGDTIAVVSQGVFSDRISKIAEAYKVNVIKLETEWGDSIKADEIEELLNNDVEKNIKAIFLPQNETTTGITNDIEAIGKTLSENGHPALLIVDVVSSLACLPFEADKWKVDVCIAASQKGFMLPPGLSMVSVSSRAWEVLENNSMPKWYWDYKAVRLKMEESQLPYTPPTTLLFGLKESLAIINEEEGLENVWARHQLIGKTTRNALKSMGLKLLAEEGSESDTVTAVHLPDGISYKDLSNLLRVKYGVVIGGGLGKLQGKIFRIGHLGAIFELDIYAVLGALEMALYELGYKVELGTAAKSMAESFINK